MKVLAEAVFHKNSYESSLYSARSRRKEAMTTMVNPGNVQMEHFTKVNRSLVSGPVTASPLIQNDSEQPHLSTEMHCVSGRTEK